MYTRNYNIARQQKGTFDYLQIEKLGNNSETMGYVALGIALGLMAFVLFTHVHNGNKVLQQKYQQLTANPPQQVMIQNAGSGTLIQ